MRALPRRAGLRPPERLQIQRLFLRGVQACVVLQRRAGPGRGGNRLRRGVLPFMLMCPTRIRRMETRLGADHRRRMSAGLALEQPAECSNISPRYISTIAVLFATLVAWLLESLPTSDGRRLCLDPGSRHQLRFWGRRRAPRRPPRRLSTCKTYPCSTDRRAMKRALACALMANALSACKGLAMDFTG
jgi:hypothetical protein